MAEPPFGGTTTADLSDPPDLTPESAVAEPPFGGTTTDDPSDTRNIVPDIA